MNTHIRSRRGFTLVELLVVITVIAVLASMVVPAIGFVRELANQTKCANNQKGIATAIMAYRSGNNEMLPGYALAKAGLTANGTGSGITTGEPAAQYTMAVFEIIAASDRGNIPTSLFKCPSQSNPAYAPDPSVMAQNIVGVTWGWGTFKIPYALDWSAPADAGSSRVILADRDTLNHKDKKAVACFADTHTSALNRAKVVGGGTGWATATGSATQGYTGPVTSAVYNDDAKGNEDETDLTTGTPTPDNIYDDNGDYSTTAANGNLRALTPGGGSARRACVR